MTDSTDSITLSKEEALEILRSLEITVVSLNRIGSASPDLSLEESRQILDEFLTDWNVFGMLSRSRTILSNAFSSERGEDDMDEVERAFQNISYWRLSARKPPSMNE